MKNKVAACAAALFVLFSLVGCSYTQTSVDSLLSPPRLSETQNAIYAALEAVAGKSLNLVYPQKGDFKSAFVINNIDSESTQEAIVFYEATQNTAAMPLRMNVLDQENQKWVSKYEIAVAADRVEKVEFVTVNQQIYIIVGYTSLASSEKTVAIYTYSNGVIDPTFSLSCTDFIVCDLDSDNKSNLLAIVSNRQNDPRTVTAQYYQINSNSLQTVSQVEMDPNVISYTNISHSKTRSGGNAVFFDGSKGSNILCTEILTMENGRLQNLIYSTVEEENLIDLTNRSYGAACMDLDNDGILEIPVIITASGYENLPVLQRQYLTEWYNYINGNLRRKRTTYVSYSLGYIFKIPERWLGKVKIDYLSGENEVYFYDYERADDYDSLLLSIKVVRRNDYQKALENGYKLLSDNGMLLYTYKIPYSVSDIEVTENDVTRNFSLI